MFRPPPPQLVHIPGCSGYLVISIWQLTPSCEKQKYTVAVSHTDTPLMVIKEVSHNRLPIQDTLFILSESYFI